MFFVQLEPKRPPFKNTCKHPGCLRSMKHLKDSANNAGDQHVDPRFGEVIAGFQSLFQGSTELNHRPCNAFSVTSILVFIYFVQDRSGTIP